MAVLCPAAWDKNCTPYRPTPGSSCGQKKSEKFSSSKKNLLQWLLTAFCHVFFGLQIHQKGYRFFSQNSPRSQERSTVKAALPEIAAWHESLVEIHQFGRHLASSADQNPSRTAHECLMKKGGEQKCVCFLFFFSNFGTLIFVWGHLLL